MTGPLRLRDATHRDGEHNVHASDSEFSSGSENEADGQGSQYDADKQLSDSEWSGPGSQDDDDWSTETEGRDPSRW